MSVKLELSDEEAEYVGDILQMWMEGIEAEVQGISTESGPNAHWSKYQLRKQFQTAGEVKIRLDMERVK